MKDGVDWLLMHHGLQFTGGLQWQPDFSSAAPIPPFIWAKMPEMPPCREMPSMADMAPELRAPMGRNVKFWIFSFVEKDLQSIGMGKMGNCL